MKLLLDEHYSPEIARRLRKHGHDVASAAERKDLVGLPDREIIRRMAGERRAILTNDAGDYIPLANQAVVAGEGHYGLLLTSDKSLPRRKAAIGRLVRILDELLAEQQRDDAFRNRIRWLP